MENLFSFEVLNEKQQSVKLSDYSGYVVLVVNVASKCGFTPQYTGLEALYKKYKDHKFIILGFPCNQFGFQEPGSDDEIQSFCKMNYDVSFPVFSKIDVNGTNSAPIYQFLKEKAPGILGTEAIKWNFTKFLVGRNGQVLKRFAPNAEPSDIEADIQNAIK